MAICGEADHPLLPVFREYYKNFSLVIQMGVTEKWLSVNGDTSGSGNIFPEKVDQQNAALKIVPDDTDYILCLDIDEFLPIDFIQDGTIDLDFFKSTSVDFQMHNFWKGGDFVGTGGVGWGYNAWCPRLFKFSPGCFFSSHRPPALILPDGNFIIKNADRGVIRIHHYSYVYRETIIRKLKYYNLIYTQFDYMKWFREVWEPWTPENRLEIEAVHSIHPSVPGAKTAPFNGEHFIQWQQ